MRTSGISVFAHVTGPKARCLALVEGKVVTSPDKTRVSSIRWAEAAGWEYDHTETKIRPVYFSMLQQQVVGLRKQVAAAQRALSQASPCLCIDQHLHEYVSPFILSSLSSFRGPT